MSFKWTYPIDSGLCDRIALSNFRTVGAWTFAQNGSLRVRRTDRWALNKNSNNSGSTLPPPLPSDFLLRNVPSSILPRFVNNQLVTANFAFLWIMTLLIEESIRHFIHSFFQISRNLFCLRRMLRKLKKWKKTSAFCSQTLSRFLWIEFRINLCLSPRQEDICMMTPFDYKG